MTRDSAEVECSLNFMGSHNSNISLKPFQKRVNATMDVVLMFLLLNLIRHLDTQSVLGNLSRKKTHFRKMFQIIELTNNKIWGACITRVKQMIFSGGILR